jgi:hypothetical protein
MSNERFWNIIDTYCEKNNMSIRGLCRFVGFRDGYLANVRSRKGRNIPSQEKIIKMAEIFTTDEMFEVLISFEKLTKEAEDLLLSLNLSKEMRIRNRIKRKLQREKPEVSEPYASMSRDEILGGIGQYEKMVLVNTNEW